MRGTLLLWCACGLPSGDVLAKKVPQFASCDEALDTGYVGAACAGITTCMRMIDCCNQKLTCENGVIRANDTDCSQCTPCTGDGSCAPGSLCTEKLCRPCTEVPSCPDCPAGQTLQKRNGCLTCECGP